MCYMRLSMLLLVELAVLSASTVVSPLKYGHTNVKVNSHGEPTSKALAKRQRQLKLDETWDVKQVLGRRPSSDKNEKWDVLVEWEWTWEPMSNLPPDCQYEAQQLAASKRPRHKQAC